MRARRIPGRCYFCGDPCASFWFCADHLWAQALVVDPATGVDVLMPEQRWWVARLSREEIVELGTALEVPPIERAETNGRRRGKSRSMRGV